MCLATGRRAGSLGLGAVPNWFPREAKGARHPVLLRPQDAGPLGLGTPLPHGDFDLVPPVVHLTAPAEVIAGRTLEISATASRLGEG